MALEFLLEYSKFSENNWMAFSALNIIAIPMVQLKHKQKINIMKKLTLITSALAIIFIFQSCATIMHGSKQEVGISSSPSNAKVIIDGKAMGTTPVVTKLKRKDSHMVQIKLDGFHTYETTLTRSVSGWVWGNIVFGGLIGLGVDAITGGLYKLTPKQISAELNDENMTSLTTDQGLYITVVLEPKPEWEKIGSLKSIK